MHGGQQFVISIYCHRIMGIIFAKLSMQLLDLSGYSVRNAAQHKRESMAATK